MMLIFLSVTSFFSLLLTLGYWFLQYDFISNWKKIQPSTNAEQTNNGWTVIIAVRNEEKNINNTINCLLSQTLPPKEIIIVNDHSTDNTIVELKSFGSKIKVLHLEGDNQGKQAALSLGIQHSSTNWLACIDADVEVSEKWLQTLQKYSGNNIVAIAGPVLLTPANTWFEKWQKLDFCGMMLITGASIEKGDYVMGNGANIAFSKQAFEHVNGYQMGASQSSVSGDDMILLSKFEKAFPNQIKFAKDINATVNTTPKDKLNSFIQQRWRWSAKTGLNVQPKLTFTLGWVWLFHLQLLLTTFLILLDTTFIYSALISWFIKLFIDYKLLKNATLFFKQNLTLNFNYLAQSVVHTLYIVFIGTLALLPLKFNWKGRKASA